MKAALLLVLLIATISCRQSSNDPPTDSLSVAEAAPPSPDIDLSPPDYDTTAWMELRPDQGFVLDLRYATKDNFTGQAIYDCGRCFVRPEAGRRLVQLQRDLQKRYGWRLRLYDCYRPRPAQQKLWEIKPDPSYVMPPHKGSMHNRGLAIDLTIDDQDGQPFDMGTDFDHFGKAAHTDHLDHSQLVLRNRRILKKVMALHGFKGIRTEWWHYSLRDVSAALSSWEWNCGSSDKKTQ